MCIKYVLSGRLFRPFSGWEITKWSLILLAVMCCMHPLHAQVLKNPVIELARQQAEQGDFDAAISTIDKYLSGKPKTFLDEAYYWKAYSFYQLKNYKAAEENYKLVLKVNPRYLPVLEDLSAMYMKQENYEAAIPYFNAAIAINDTNINLINSRGLCYYYSDKFELAIKDFKRVIKLDPTNYMAYNNAGSAEYNNQNIATAHISDLILAEKYFNQSLALKPDFQIAIRNRGIVHFYMDSLEEAYTDLLRAAQLDPTDYKSSYFLGKLLQKQKKYIVALQFYDNSIKLANYRSEVYVDRGLCKMETEDFKGARADYYKAMQLTDDDGEIEYEVARSFAAQDNIKEAILALKEAKKMGLFKDVRYFTYINKDKYFSKYYKNKEWQDAIYELKFGKK